MNRWKSIAFLLSISLNVAMVAGYLYGAVFPRSVQSYGGVPPGLRDPNLTRDQIQAIKHVQAGREAFLDLWEEQYRAELLEIITVLDTRDPDWQRVHSEQAKFLKLRQEYQDYLFRSWSDINHILTAQQGKQYMEAIRDMVRSTEFAPQSRSIKR